MPQTFSLLPIPEGDWNDVFEQQGKMMASVHNTFIRGLNAIITHAPSITESQVKAFAKFCMVYTDNIHAHHMHEEELYFPEIEKRVGEHSMAHNVDQHKAFLPALEVFEAHVKAIYIGEKPYDKVEFLSLIDKFAEPLVEHLGDEIETLDPARLRNHFSPEEMRALGDGVEKKAVAHATLDETVPLFLITHDVNYCPGFHPIPKILAFAVKYWFSRKYKDSWAFGPCDLDGNLKAVITVTPAVN